MPPAFEVLLLNTAIPQIQAAQSGDTYVVPRDIAFSAALTLTAGTANGVPYLNASKVLTTGSALTFDGTNLVNTSSSVGTPEIAIANSATSAGANARLRIKTGGSGSTTYGDAFIQFTDSLNWNWSIGAGSSTSNNLTFNQYFGLTSNELMRLTSTGLGIGESNPGFKLHVVGTSQLSLSGAGTQQALLLNNNDTTAGTQAVKIGFSSSSVTKASINAAVYGNDYMTFNVGSDTERARISSDGTFRVKGAGTAGTTDAVQFSGSAPASAMTLDASGRLLVGGTTASNTIFRADRSNSSVGDATVNSVGHFVNTYDNNTNGSTAYPVLSLERLGSSGISNNSLFEIGLSRYSTASTDAYTQANFIVRDGNSTSRTTVATLSNNLIAFSTNNAERARITSGGYFKASDNGSYNNVSGTYHELYQSTVETAVAISAVNASFANNILQLNAARNTTNNSFYALSYYNSGAGAYKLRVADSGDVTNTNGTYGTISDAKMKTDIVDAGSQWPDIKALRFRKFKMKDDPSGLVQLGVVAQEVELTSPGLVDEHADKDAEGNDLGTTTKSVKTSVLLMKAAVALQEAMARIEKLEAEVATLKGA